MLVGCSYTTSSISGEEITVGFMAAEFSNEFMIAMQQGFLDRMESLGLEVKMLLCNVDPAVQISQEEDLIVQGVDALVIRPAGFRNCRNTDRNCRTESDSGFFI